MPEKVTREQKEKLVQLATDHPFFTCKGLKGKARGLLDNLSTRLLQHTLHKTGMPARKAAILPLSAPHDEDSTFPMQISSTCFGSIPAFLITSLKTGVSMISVGVCA